MNKTEFKQLLHQHDELYHRGTPSISDAEYDSLIDKYQLLYGTYKRKQIKTPSILPICGPSLAKRTTAAEIEQFDITFPGEKVIMDKIDGISMFCHYTHTGIRLYTHSDECHGNDISHLLPYFNIPKNVKDEMIIRGELTIRLELFENQFNDQYTSPRNMMTLVNSISPNGEVIKQLTYLAFQLTYVDKQLPILEQLVELKKLGFDVVNYQLVDKLNYLQLVERLESPFDFLRDGLVLAQNQHEVITSALPKNKIAFKIVGEMKETTVTHVTWQVSKRLLLKPIVHYESVFLDYANLTSVNGLHAKFIITNKIGPGARIVMTRRGGIIPYIQSVVEGTVASMPEEAYEWDKTNTNIVVKLNDEARIKRIYTFFDTMGVKYLGLKTIEKLYQHGYHTVNDVVITTIDKLLFVDGIKKAGAQRIINEVNMMYSRLTLVKVMMGSCLFPGFGEVKISAIVNHLPVIYDIVLSGSDNTLAIDDIKQVNGVDEMAELFVEHVDEFCEFMDGIPSIKQRLINNKSSMGDIDLPVVADETSDVLMGMVIVFSGDKKLTEKVRRMGAVVDSGVTKRTTLLVVNELGSMNGKEKTCLKKNIPVLSLKEFTTKYL